MIAIIFHVNRSVHVFCRYFEDDDDEQKSLNDLEYQPAPGSPTLERLNAGGAKGSDDSDSDDSDDPLESFMAGIEVILL